MNRLKITMAMLLAAPSVCENASRPKIPACDKNVSALKYVLISLLTPTRDSCACTSSSVAQQTAVSSGAASNRPCICVATIGIIATTANTISDSNNTYTTGTENLRGILAVAAHSKIGSMIIAINHANAKSNNGPASSSVITANRSTRKKDNPIMARGTTSRHGGRDCAPSNRHCPHRFECRPDC